MRAELIGSNGPLSGHTIPLENAEVTLGRAPSNDVCVPDRSVSREHCVIRRSGDQFEICDKDSYNGTFVNRLRVHTHPLTDGDEIAAGNVTFVFRTDVGSASALIGGGDLAVSGALTLCAPDVPLARETAALMRVSEIARTLQTLYLQRGGADRPTMERRLFEAIFDLVPSERGALFMVEGDTPVALAGYDGATASASVSVPETVLRDIIGSGSAMAGGGAAAWLAAPLLVSGRVIGIVYLDSGGATREYLDGDIQTVSAVAEVLGLALENARDLESLRFANVQLSAGDPAADLMVGNSAVMTTLYEAISRAARGSATVLILGESGTGKELVAKAIHRNSPRAARPFVAVNCAAVAETLLESEFFGHEKGAFTGAYAQRKGRFEQADGGTVFLDEVSELAPALQAKLLRVLQERQFERVGGSRPIRVDVRIIAATNRDLEQRIKDGLFREDLFYRLNVVPLRVPPLRQRREDIPLLANWFIRKFSEHGDRQVTGLSREARAMLVTHDWPGNVRELQNIMERAVVMGSSDVVTPEDLADLLPDADPAPEQEGGFHEQVRQTRRRLIATALERAGGNVPEAARALKLHPNYLHRLITTLGLRALVSGAV